MADFMIQFLICNLFICAITVLLLLAKRVLGNFLTSRMQFNVWFLLLGILAVPFLPFCPARLPQLPSWLHLLQNIPSSAAGDIAKNTSDLYISGTAGQLNDFALSVSKHTPSIIWLLLGGIWIAGILASTLFLIKSKAHLHALRKSALPLQNKEIRALYSSCLDEMGITASIPIYSTAFLASPIITGLLKPCIYLPIHLISDFSSADMGHTPSDAPGQSDRLRPIKYMLLHELQHYRHKDALANCLMNLAATLYWFNPVIWHALGKMRLDREIACDASVLELLEEKDYEDYGRTLISLAEKISTMPFPFAAGIGGNRKQLQRRILHIAHYKKPSVRQRLKGITAFGMIAAAFLSIAPMLSIHNADNSHYPWDTSSENISIADLSAYFGGYEGSFVLYDMDRDAWTIYDMGRATLRTPPDSTYKIYDALFGLEEGIIEPKHSRMAWDGTSYPFESWNGDQDLISAMKTSVNWYFQAIDNQLGTSAIKHYLQEISYGNEALDADLSSYWMQSSLRISPVEQVKLLVSLYDYRLGFSPENIDAVKRSICLFSSENRNFYGKTGTGRVDGQDVNGWFIGYMEAFGHTYFYATNIQHGENATGIKASEISFSILSGMDIWKPSA